MNVRRTDGRSRSAPAPAPHVTGAQLASLTPRALLRPSWPQILPLLLALAVTATTAGAGLAQGAPQTPPGGSSQFPVLPPDGVVLPRPSLQPGLPGAPSFTRPAPQAEVKGERLINGPHLPSAIDAGQADEAHARPAKGKPAQVPEPPAGADLAYGAYQRGYYATAARAAEARLKANPGDASAAALLGLLYEQGLGVHLDLAKAARSYTQADRSGSIAGTFALAMMTLQGRGVDKDDVAGKRLLEKAAAAGHPSACYNLALVKLSEGTVGADREAVALLQRAVDAGLPDAEYMLSTLYRKGRGTVADDIKATRLLQRAAGNRLLAAEVEYAIALFNGNGVHKDEAGAARLFLKAALDGNAVAQNRLARLLTMGRGVTRNQVEAAGWHLLASGQGLDDAWLDEALKGLTPAERGKAEAFAASHREPLIGGAR